MHPYLDWPGPIAFAHRGGTSEYPENTMPAFEHAVSLGYRYLETDVHRTADGVLVAFHDANLERTCGVDAEIAELPWSQIRDLRVDGREPIPLMRELLDEWPDVRFNIDCKADDAVRPLAALLNEVDALGRVCIGSFSHRRLHRLRHLLGRRLLTALSPPEIASLRLTGRLPGHTSRAAQVPTSRGRPSGFGHVEVVTEHFIRHAHAHQIAVHVWTINDDREMDRLLDLGVDGIMTDRPEVLREVFDRRGIWHQ